MKIREFFENKVNWLILLAMSMWLDGMTTAYNLVHGRTEHNPLVSIWFNMNIPGGFVLNASLTGIVLYFFMKRWDNKGTRYFLWAFLVFHMVFSWIFNIIKISG